MSELKMLPMQLAKVEEDLTKATERTNFPQEERREMKKQLNHTMAEELLLEEKVERLPRAEADANRAQQDRREMKEQLDRTVAEKLQLEDQLEAQKKAARDWKLKLDEMTCKPYSKGG